MKLYMFLMLFTVLSWFPRVKKTDHVFIMPLDFPSGASGKELSRQCRRQKRHGFDPWVGKILWRRKQQPTPVFLPGESHGQTSLKCYSLWGHKELDTIKWLRSSIMPLIIFNVFLQSNILEIYFLVYYNIFLIVLLLFSLSDSLRPHGLQHARLPCPLPRPRAFSSSCPLSWWCHPTISSSVIPFSFCLQSFPASGSFPMSQFFASGGQSIGVSASASVLPMNIQGLFPLGWTGWISLQSKGLSRVFSNTTVQKHQFCNSRHVSRRGWCQQGLHVQY